MESSTASAILTGQRQTGALAHLAAAIILSNWIRVVTAACTLWCIREAGIWGRKWKSAEQFSAPHNYLDDSGILRKGAISARDGESVVIPANMRDGVILGIGKGNADWNYSAPMAPAESRGTEICPEKTPGMIRLFENV